MKTKEEIFALLDAKIPAGDVSTRQGGGDKALSYLEGWLVINRMNAIFGADGWSYDTTELRCVHSGKIAGKYGDVESASYVATVALFVQFPDGTQAKRITDVGFGNGTDKTDPGKPHELATKEAVTDALKRCAKSLGMSLGLALYDKKQENVGDEEPTGMSQDPAYKAKATKHAPPKTVAPTKVDDVFERLKPATEREALNKRIAAMNLVVLAQAGPEKSPARIDKLTELRAGIKAKYGVATAAELNDEQAKELLTNLENQANGQ